jgi:hypothetical protein
MTIFSKKQPDLPRRRQTGPGATDRTVAEPTLEERYAFKRNRTLTGSASSHVRSTNESNAQLKSARVQAHDLASQRRNIGVVLGAVVLSVIILYMLISQFTASVVVQSSDVSMTLDTSYEKSIQTYLNSQPIERLRFTLNEAHLNAYLQTANPEVAAVKVDGSAGFGASRFIITLRAPIAGWSINGVNQYVDATGVSFSRNYFPTPRVQIVDQSGVQIAAGQAVASDQFLSFVGRVVGLAGQQNYVVTQVIIPEGTTRQVELKMKDVNYPVKLSVDRPAGEQVEDMTRAVKWLQGHNLTPEYVDVRVSGKAFYR